MVVVNSCARQDDTQHADHACPSLEKLHIYFTSRCNQRCKHCWIEASPIQRDHLRSPEVNRQIDIAIPLGLRYLKITGGEPLLFKDETISILHHALRVGLTSKLETNGILICDKVAAELAELGTIVSISLDGASSETHDTFRCAKGSFERVLRAVEKLVRVGVTVEAVSCIHSGNIHQANEIVLLCAGLGISYLKLNFPSPYGRAIELANRGGLLSIPEILEIVRHLEQQYPLGNSPIELDFDIARALRKYPRDGLRCKVKNLISILPDGRYSLCGIGVTHKEITFGTIKKQNIDEVWRTNTVLWNLRNAISDRGTGICELCTEYDACIGHCIAYGISEFNSIGAEHPLCRDAYDKRLFPESKLKAYERS